jgi:hypothetical protein
LKNGEFSTECWKRYSEHFKQEIANRKNSEIICYLENVAGFALASFDGMDEKATQNKDIYQKMKIIFALFSDSSRSLVPLAHALTIVSAATQSRGIFEIYAVLKFIFESEDANKYSDRYMNFIVVDRIQAGNRGVIEQIAQTYIDTFRKAHPYWFKNGELIKKPFWTGEEQFKSIRSVAIKADLKDWYNQIYSPSSSFVHGASFAWRFFKSDQGLESLPKADYVYTFSLISALFLLESIKLTGNYFKTGFNSDECNYLIDEFKRLQNELQVRYK